MAQLALMDAYHSFLVTARPFISIENEPDYAQAMDALADALEAANDELDDPLNPLIDMLTNSIEIYESRNKDLSTFVTEAGGIPADVALLKTLMAQYQLTGSDLPEIGGKAMVSKVLRCKRSLSRSAIERLSARFGLRPSMFFDDGS
jgi:HTH-type transcriptional regulator/antitoxin HigA